MVARRKDDFTDKDDFTPVHDRIMLQTLQPKVWQSIVLEVCKPDERFTVVEGTIEGEPIVKEKYKPDVYPDAVVKGTFKGDHRAVPLKIEIQVKITISCAVDMCGHRFTQTFLLEEELRPKPEEVRFWDGKCWGQDHRNTPVKITVDGYHLTRSCSVCERVEKTEHSTVPVEVAEHWTDLCQFTGEYGQPENFFLIFEIKPKVHSFGSDLRQINTYRDRLGGKAVLITEDERIPILDGFRSQGVYVVSANTNLIFASTLEQTEPALAYLNPLIQFAEECCVLGLEHSINHATIRMAYHQWAQRTGSQIYESNRAMGQRILAIPGVSAGKDSSGNRIYKGIALKGVQP